MPIAELFDGTRLEFPEDTDPAVIQSTVKRLTLERQPKQKEGLLSNLQRGAESTYGDIRTGLAGVLNPTEAAKTGIEREEEMRQRLGPQESRLSKVEKAYADKGLLSAIGTGLGEIPGAITEQVPQLATAFGGARTGAMLGAPAGPYGAAIGAGVGAFLPFFFQQYGGNIKQQAEVQKERGEEVDVSGAKGAAFAVPMAGLDVAEAYIPFGKQIVGKMFGPSVEKLLNRGLTKEAEEAAAKKLSQESFLPSLKNMDLGTVVKGTAKTSLLEIPTEVTQQLLGRAQSGQDLFSKEAMREYGETAFDVALLGPLGILGRVGDKAAARQTILKAQQDAAKAGEPQPVSIDVIGENNQPQKIDFFVDSSGEVGKSLDDFEHKKAYEQKRNDERLARREAKKKALENPNVFYGTQRGDVGADLGAVQQADTLRNIQEDKTEQIQSTVTPEIIKSFGIGHTANIFKDKDVIGADLRDPIQATIVKNKLLNLRDKHSNQKVKDNINTFLSRPEFNPEKIGTPVQPTQQIEETKKPEPLVSDVWQSMQNRDRSTDSSINQMNSIANKPDYDRVSISKSFTEGAPVVSGNIKIPDNQLGKQDKIVGSNGEKIPVQYAVVDAGEVMPSHNVNGQKNPEYVSQDYQGLRAITNGRVAGLQAAYARGTMNDYVTDLQHDDTHGISKDVINGMKNPMLVRLMPQEYITKHTGDVSNTGAGLSLNVIEQAKNDINRINVGGIEFGEDGDVTEKTVRDFIKGMPSTEQNNLITKDGTPSKQAYDRLNAAIFQQAYQNDRLTELAFQSPDEEIRNIVKALNVSAPNAIHLEGLGEYDIRPFVNEAVEMAINAKRNGIKLSDMVKQSDITTHPLSKDILDMFAKNIRSAKAIGENLNTLFDNVFEEATQPADMFGGASKKPIHQIIKESFEKAPEADLFTPKDKFLYEVPYEATPALKQNINELTKKIQKSMDKMGLHGVGVTIGKELKSLVNGKMTKVNGLYLDRLIVMSLDSPNIMSTFGHEQLHALRDLGMFSDREWQVLSTKAKTDWIKKYDIERRYKGKSEEVKIEEAIASAFGDYTIMGGAPRSLLARIKEFFERLGNALRGMGFKTSDMVFNRRPEDIFRKATEGRLEGAGRVGTGETRNENQKTINDLAGYTPERLKSLFSYYSVPNRPNVAKAYIAYVNPIDFIDATTTKQMREYLEKEITPLDREKLAEEYQEIYLDIDLINGQAKIRQHEGRHRMLALANAGIERVPVVINTGNWNANAEPIKSLSIKGQKFVSYDKDGNQLPESGKNITVNDLTPISGAYKDYAVEKFGNPQANVMFEIPLEGVDPKVAQMAEKTFGKQEPKSYVETIKDLGQRFRDRFKYYVADDLSDIAKYSEEGYMKGRLSKTVDTQMQVILDYGHLEVRGGTLGYKRGTKGLKEIYAPLGNEVERFQIWLALNRDANLPLDKRSFKEDLVRNRDQFIQGDINGVPRKQVYEKAREEQQALNKSVLDVSKELGLIDSEAYQRFVKDAFYIPFYKEMENGDVEGARIASKLTGQKFSHALKGGEKKVNDLMDNMLRNWSHIISASLKNDAALTTLKDAENLGVATRVKAFQKDNPDVVKVMENGAPAYFKVEDQDLIDNIAQIIYIGKQSALFKAMTKPSNWLRYGVTLNPAYKVRNIIKDSMTTVGVSSIDPNMLNNVRKGWTLTNKASDEYADALASGALFQLGSSHDGKSADLIKKLIAEGVNDETILNTPEKMASGLKKAFKAYKDFGNRLENVNRMALYDKLIKEGKSPLEAAYESRDLLDFTAQGASRSLKVLSQLVPFMNTRIQGLYKLYRTGTDAQKQQRLYYTLGAIALASAALYMINKDDEDFQKRQDWDRDNFWWFKVGDTAFRIPKPYEIGGIGTLAERGLEQFVDDSVESKVFFSRMGQYVLDTLSLDPTPQAIKPMWSVLNNRDSFTDAPIETPGMERYTKTERFADKTSGVAKGLSQAINMPLSAVGMENAGPSPVQIDYLAQGYFGWLGGLLGSTAARAFEDKPTKPLLDAAGLAQTEPEVNSKYLTDFYRSNAKIQNNFNDLKRYAEQGNTEKVTEILKEKGDLIALQKLYSQTVNQIAEQRKYIQMISNQKDISREEREQMIVNQKLIMSKMAENVETIRKSLRK